ncbi:hypothetical protein [Paraburkholderia pallida]|uniref:Uncharacterized protein n=1 Tax=Paraburkholderia pallida TaxID=2547399 RepID=A0A4P7CM48_9BURK|nr:hypothetical protein [Paraburkholderia pallida]QBQ95927.1 hypothetical protein E1956_01190 [Paraburkholderia pallida]
MTIGREDESDLSEEQRDTTNLLSHLLGQAFADRYVDFCRLVGEKISLRVSRPLAAHALREFESSLRQTLTTVTDARQVFSVSEQENLQRAAQELAVLGFDDTAIRRALKALPNRRNHRDEILGIIGWLGLPLDGDVAGSWISLDKGAGRAHERSFHKSLHVDDEFRIAFQEPFELVVRGVALALQRRYSALLRRVEELVSVSDKAQAVALFEKEIPGALPLQWHFFQRLQTPDWLPHLANRKLLTHSNVNASAQFPFGAWPAGSYLLRMAGSADLETREQVIAVLRIAPDFEQREMRFIGMEILAALPANEAAPFATVVARWLDRDIRNMSMHIPERLLTNFAEAGQTDAALIVARALLQVFEEGGGISTLYARHMYEYSLPTLVTMLTRACGLEALGLFVALLREAAIADGKLRESSGVDHSHITLGSIASGEHAAHDTYSALVSAVRTSAELLAQQVSCSMHAVVTLLVNVSNNIFKRIAIHVLAKNPASEPELAQSWLTDSDLIEDSLYAEEYAALALAWYPSLKPDAQNALLNSVRAVPGRYRDAWKARREQRGQPVSVEDERMFDALVLRDMLWHWRAVLPDEVQAELNVTVEKYGNPDEWKHGIAFPREENPPLWASDFSTKTVAEIVDLFSTWTPRNEKPWEAVAAFAHQWRLAVQREPGRYAESAKCFVDVPPSYVHELFEGLEDAAKSQSNFAWAPVLDLVSHTFSKLGDSVGEPDLTVAGEQGWIQACRSASELLKSGLRRGAESIPFEEAATVQSLVFILIEKAPREPEVEDFEERFARDAFLAATATLRGSALELCVLWLFWLSKSSCSQISVAPRTALHMLPQVAQMLETQLADLSPSGRIPRAILGRYLDWLFYFGADWIRGNLDQILPNADDALHQAAWQAHLIHGGRPVSGLYAELQWCYADELRQMRAHDAGGDDIRFRLRRFGDYMLILYLNDVLQIEHGLFAQFLQYASAALRRHVMWSVGQYLQLPPDKFSEKDRSRALAYWEARLAAAKRESNRDLYEDELEIIGHWVNNPHLETSWLMEQLLAMLDAGFIPTFGFDVVGWLANVCTQDVGSSLRILAAMVDHPECRPDTYMVQQSAIRTIFSEAAKSGSEEIIDLMNQTISILSTRGETGYLDLEQRH